MTWVLGTAPPHPALSLSTFPRFPPATDSTKTKVGGGRTPAACMKRFLSLAVEEALGEDARGAEEENDSAPLSVSGSASAPAAPPAAAAEAAEAPAAEAASATASLPAATPAVDASPAAVAAAVVAAGPVAAVRIEAGNGNAEAGTPTAAPLGEEGSSPSPPPIWEASGGDVDAPGWWQTTASGCRIIRGGWCGRSSG